MKLMMRNVLCLIFLIMSVGAFADSKKNETTKPASCLASNNNVAERDGSHDFDFFSGRKWKVKGRKRIGRFVGSTKWEDVEGFENSRRLGDKGMIEELTFPDWRPGFKLIIVRIYDEVKRKWLIYDAAHQINTRPLVGSFEQGLGIFVGDDEINGQKVKVRYIWTCDWVHPRFQQEFSNDGGKTWEIDWRMEFTEIKE